MSKLNNHTSQYLFQGVNVELPARTTLSSILQGDYTIAQVSEAIIEGADVNEVLVSLEGQDTYTPLIYAVMQQDPDLVELLLHNNADVNKQNGILYCSPSPLHKVMYYYNKEILNLLLNTPYVEINIRNALGWTPLHCAKSAESAVILLDHGADIASADDIGLTPLHHSHNVLVATALLERGANIDTTSIYGTTPLSHSVVTRKIALVEFFLDQKRERESDYRPGLDITGVLAKCYFEEAIFDLLASRGANFNQIEPHYYPLIHNSIINNNLALLTKLVNTPSVDKNLLDPIFQESPLHYAISQQRVDCIRILLEGGADANLMNCYSQTPLERCLFWGEIAVLDMFKGQDTKHNFMGMNPHHSSVFYSCRPESMGFIYTFLQVQVHGNSVITESCVLAPDHITQAGGLSPDPLLEILGELKNFFE